MAREYVALLRAIAHVQMQPFREAMEELGFTDVASFGMSGNLLFNTEETDVRSMEDRIAERLKAVTFVRTRSELARVVARDPFREHPDGSVLFLARPVDRVRRQKLMELDFEGDPPLIHGKTAFFAHPTQLRGKRTPINLERVLGIQGTARSSRIVARILERMSEPTSKDGP